MAKDDLPCYLVSRAQVIGKYDTGYLAHRATAFSFLDVIKLRDWDPGNQGYLRVCDWLLSYPK